MHPDILCDLICDQLIFCSRRWLSVANLENIVDSRSSRCVPQGPISFTAAAVKIVVRRRRSSAANCLPDLHYYSSYRWTGSAYPWSLNYAPWPQSSNLPAMIHHIWPCACLGDSHLIFALRVDLCELRGVNEYSWVPFVVDKIVMVRELSQDVRSWSNQWMTQLESGNASWPTDRWGYLCDQDLPCNVSQLLHGSVEQNDPLQY